MRDWWNSTKASFMVWKLALTKVTLMALIAGGTVLQTSLSGLDWSKLNGTEKTMLCLGVFIAAANVIVAFLDKTMSRITGEQTETTFLTKEQIKQP